jgi:hypothetical protein
MSTDFRTVPGFYAGQSITPRNIFTTAQSSQVHLEPTFGLIDGTASRDPGSSSVSLLRAGLLMGIETSNKKYAPSIIGVLSAAVGGSQTSLTVPPAVATELVRRQGGSGTFTLTGPPATGGVVRSFTATYSAVNTSTGVVTISALGTGAVSGVNAVEALPFVDTTGSGTFTLTIEGVTTGAITYSSTAATLFANINTALNATFGTSAIVASGGSLAAIILTFSGTGYTNRPIANSSNGTVSGVKVIATLLAGATGFTAGNNPTSSGVGAALAGGSTTTTAGVAAVTATGGEFVAGSLIQPTDGSQQPITILCNEYGIDVNDRSGNSLDQMLPQFVRGGDLLTANLIDFVTDDFGNTVEPSVQAWLKAQLRAVGVFTFDNDRVG